MDQRVLTDDMVIPKQQAAELMNLSPFTLHRLYRRGEGPKRIQLSTRRVGYRVRDIRAWLEAKAS